MAENDEFLISVSGTIHYLFFAASEEIQSASSLYLPGMLLRIMVQNGFDVQDFLKVLSILQHSTANRHESGNFCVLY